MSGNSPETLCSKFTSESQIPGFLYSLSLPSEPPDIRNWFSSYVYESPTLDVEDDFSGSLVSSIETELEKEDFRNPKHKGAVPDVGERCSLKGLAQCIESFGNNNEDKWSEIKSKHWVEEGIEGSPVLSNFLPKRIDEERLEEEQGKCHDFTSRRYDRSSSLNSGNPLQRVEGKLSEEVDPILENLNENSSLNGLNFPKELLDRKDCIKNSIKQVCFVSVKGDVDMKGVDDVYAQKEILQGNGKENEGKYSSENGFISTRKKRNTKADDVSSSKRKSQEVQVKFSRNSDVGVQRGALMERTNFQFETVPENAGKWRCPQKSKPNLGPPLKQLRMEQWVHRV